MPKTRDLSIDIAKGIAIILMVWGHCASPLHNEFYLFHMPAFILMSGMFFSTRREPVSFIINKLRTLLLPAYVFIIFINICYTIGDTWTTLDFIIKTTSVRTLFFTSSQEYGALWFLICLFTITMIYYPLKMLEIPKFLLLMINILIAFGGAFVSHEKIMLPFCLSQAMLLFNFYYIGDVFRDQFKKTSWIAIAVCACIFTVGMYRTHFIPNHTTDVWALNIAGSYPEYLIMGLTGTYLLIQFSKWLASFPRYMKPIAFLGLNSLYILGPHQAFTIFGMGVITQIRQDMIDMGYSNFMVQQTFIFLNILCVAFAIVCSVLLYRVFFYQLEKYMRDSAPIEEPSRKKSMGDQQSSIGFLLGVSLVLIVVANMMYYNTDSPLAVENSKLYKWLESFSIPLFITMMGYKVNALRQTMLPLWPRLKRIILTMLMPYIGWSLIAGKYMGWFDHLSIDLFFNPIGGYWLIWTLFVYGILYTIYDRIVEKKNITNRWIEFLTALLIFSVPGLLDTFYHCNAFSLPTLYLPFFVLGVLAKRFHIYERLLEIEGAMSILMIVFCIASITHTFTTDALTADLSKIAAGLACPFAMLYFADTNLTFKHKPSKWLLQIGKNALGIYMMHFLILGIYSRNSSGGGLTNFALDYNPFWVLVISLILSSGVIYFCIIINRIFKSFRFLRWLVE